MAYRTRSTRHRISRGLVIGAVLALVLTAAGCGGDDDALEVVGTTTTTTGDDAPDGSSTTSSTVDTSTPDAPEESVENAALCALFDDESFRETWVPRSAPGQVDTVEILPVADASVAEPADGCVRRVLVSFLEGSDTVETTVTVDVLPFTDDLLAPEEFEGTVLATWSPVDGHPGMYTAMVGSLPLGGLVVVDGLAYRISTGRVSSHSGPAGEPTILETEEDVAAADERMRQQIAAATAESERDLVASLALMADTFAS